MENIIYGVTSAIKAYFGKNIKIYTDTINQGFQKPCFIVLPEKSAMERMSIGRFKKTLTVKIIYYPEDISQNNEMEKTAFKLCAAINIIKWEGDSFLAKNTKWEVINEKLTFFADFDSILYWNKYEDAIEDDFNYDADFMMNMDFTFNNP